MSRRETVDAAKRLVLDYGATRILEQGTDIVTDAFLPEHLDSEAVVKEAARQAERVYRFLGYDIKVSDRK